MKTKQVGIGTIVVSVVAIWANIGFAQMNALDIRGPFEVAPGELVRLTAEIQPEESPFWIVLNPPNLDYEQVEDGHRLLFAVGCHQQSEVVVVLLAQQVMDQRIVTRQIRRRIKIRRPNDTDQPPDENPNDPPSTPITEFPMYRLVAAAMKKIESVEAKSKGHLIAKSFEQTATACESGSINSIPDIWESLSQANARILGPLTSYWEPVGVAMQSEFKRLRIADVKSHAVHLRAAAAAIKQEFSHE